MLGSLISCNYEKRLQRISEALKQGHSLLRDITDDELGQVITGNPKTKASDLTTEYLQAVISGDKKRG
jgi:succinate dehydrogenase flavin-adding protein (antitoxin of CptAB toxin-antitoxin module)